MPNCYLSDPRTRTLPDRDKEPGLNGVCNALRHWSARHSVLRAPEFGDTEYTPFPSRFGEFNAIPHDYSEWQ